jgi:four helix bundle protein
MRIERFEDIESWQLARELTKAVYAIVRTTPLLEDYSLRNQLTGAAGSIMHNIAEGFDAGSNREFIRFLRYAKRSCTEVQSELYVALDQRYCTLVDFDELYEQARLVRAKIGAFIKYLSKPRTVNPEP